MLKYADNVEIHVLDCDYYWPTDEEGNTSTPDADADKLARKHLGVDESTPIEWRLPRNVFDVRYGSSYVATAIAGDCAVRFVSDDGDFVDGDDA